MMTSKLFCLYSEVFLIIILNMFILGTKFCLWLLDQCPQLGLGSLRSLWNFKSKWLKEAEKKKVLNFTARNALFFHSLMLIKAKGKEGCQSGVPTYQSAQIFIFTSDFFLEPNLKYLVTRPGHPRLPPVPYSGKNGKNYVLLYLMLILHFYCKQQLWVIKAGPFVLLFCKQSGLLVNMETIWISIFSFHHTRCWSVLSFPLQNSHQELDKT